MKRMQITDIKSKSLCKMCSALVSSNKVLCRKCSAEFKEQEKRINEFRREGHSDGCAVGMDETGECECRKGMGLKYQNKIWDMVEEASSSTDGHFTLMKFTTHWKAMFGTPDLNFGVSYDEVWDIAPSETMFEAIEKALLEKYEREARA